MLRLLSFQRFQQINHNNIKKIQGSKVQNSIRTWYIKIYELRKPKCNRSSSKICDILIGAIKQLNWFTWLRDNDVNNVVLLSLLLTLNRFYILFGYFNKEIPAWLLNLRPPILSQNWNNLFFLHHLLLFPTSINLNHFIYSWQNMQKICCLW